MPVEEQVAIIYLGSKGLLAKVPVDKVRQFEQQFLTMMRNAHADTLAALKRGEFNDQLTDVLEKVAADLSKNFAS
jgi:F-type H+-transporting ATPase subunit alpha